MSRVNKNPHAGKTGAKREFIKLVNDMAVRGRRHSDIMRDFAECAYLCIAQRTPFTSPDRATAMEERFVQIVKRGGGEPYRDQLAQMLGIATAGLEETGDFFGSVVADLGALNEGLGQFFTPYELSRLMAEINIGDDLEAMIAEQGFVTIMEPTAGSGGMVIAFAEAFRARGFSTSSELWATAIDIDPFCFHMSYVQLALHDIAADVYLGNSLSNEYSEVASTPAKVELIARKGSRIRQHLERHAAPREVPAAVGLPVPAPNPVPQLELFGGAK